MCIFWFYVGFFIWGFLGCVDLLHIMSFLPKDLNFVNHSSYIGWREYDRMPFRFIDFTFMLVFKFCVGAVNEM